MKNLSRLLVTALLLAYVLLNLPSCAPVLRIDATETRYTETITGKRDTVRVVDYEKYYRVKHRTQREK